MIRDVPAGVPTLARIPQILDRVEVRVGTCEQIFGRHPEDRVPWESGQVRGFGRPASVVSVEGDKARAPATVKPGVVEWVSLSPYQDLASMRPTACDGNI